MTQTQERSRRQLAMMLAALVAVMPFSIDAYLPAMPQMAQALGAHIHQVERSLSVFIFGVALGQLCGGALSDVQGRRTVTLFGLAVYVAATVALPFVGSVEGLLLWRFVQAVGGGMATVTVAAVVRDRFEGQEAAQMFALIGIITMMAPLAAPMIGALLKQFGGWQAIFVFLGVYAAAVAALLYRRMPASVQPRRRFDRALLRDIGANYRRVFRQPEALGFLFCQALCFSAMVVFLTESSFVYMELYHLGSKQYALAFGANIFTMMFFNRVTAYSLRRTDAKNILIVGIALQLVCNLAAFLLVCFGGLPPFAVLLGLMMVSVGTQGLIVANTQACYMGYFKQEGGSANAVLGTVQFSLAGLIGWLTTQAHNGSAQVMPGMMLASTVAAIALLWLFSRRVWLDKGRTA
ncbi:DHA1 family bicyclomycin/chloramphenicol resistance-like MFS transporter [Neisseria sp. HSC-16F19]|nr:multidrug effflux MFS transporter [Neisseria sp. HSC-16F19]MCP2041030.1 DHA1 family bicyclomycin/chloramphenicol resistance-like MFS transporter [Neisseria sp. HSC-16F19]